MNRAVAGTNKFLIIREEFIIASWEAYHSPNKIVHFYFHINVKIHWTNCLQSNREFMFLWFDVLFKKEFIVIGQAI
jgi:hypothetical protein